MKNFDEYFMSVAIEEAKMAFSEDEIPVGCVLVCNNEIIARGHNYRKHDNLVISHAEINAILQANRKLQNYILSDCVLYVTLEPCSMCIGAIQQAHIKRVVYGARDEKAGALGGLYDFFLTPRLNFYPFITSGVLEKECAAILKEYFKQKRLK